jgi:formamidase
MKTHVVEIDRSRTLAEQPRTGHNRWHEAIPPILTVAEGDRVVLDTRDAFDGQITPASGAEDVRRASLGPVHPLTGPIYVEGAEPGDLLEVRIHAIEP